MFPAEALARELSARGFGRRARHRPARPGLRRQACPASRSIACAPAGSAAGIDAASVTALAEMALGTIEARAAAAPARRRAAVVGFGGYPSVPTMLAATRARAADRAARAERAAGPRQSPARAARRRDRHLVPETAGPAPGRCMRVRPDRQSGAAGDRRCAATPYRRRHRTARSTCWSLGGSQGARILSAVVPRGAGALAGRRCAAASW